jgi:hypothetical protein
MDLDVAVAVDGGVFWSCAHTWQPPAAPTTCADVNAVDPQSANDCCYVYGLHAQRSERCDVYLYYYPRAANVFCQ